MKNYFLLLSAFAFLLSCSSVVKPPCEASPDATHEYYDGYLPYNNIEDAFNRANALDVAFQAAVYTKDIDTALLCVKSLNATAVMVNDHTAFRVDWMPFGGAKASGLGMGGILNSMEEMSNEKLMVIKSNVL